MDIEDQLVNDVFLPDALDNLFTNLDDKYLAEIKMNPETLGDNGHRGNLIVQSFVDEYGDQWLQELSEIYELFVNHITSEFPYDNDRSENARILLNQSVSHYKRHEYMDGFLTFRQAVYHMYYPQIEVALLKYRDLDKTIVDIALGKL